MMNCMAWNVRGVAKRGLANHVRTLVTFYGAKVLAIFEPRVSGDTATHIAKRFGFDSFHFEHVEGFSGGI